MAAPASDPSASLCTAMEPRRVPVHSQAAPDNRRSVRAREWLGLPLEAGGVLCQSARHTALTKANTRRIMLSLERSGQRHAARDTALGPRGRSREAVVRWRSTGLAGAQEGYHQVRARPDGTILRVTSFPLHPDDRMKNPLVRNTLTAIAGYVRRRYYANPIFGAVAAWLGAPLHKGAAT